MTTKGDKSGLQDELHRAALNNVTRAMQAMFRARQLMAQAAMKCRIADIHDTARRMDHFYEELEKMDNEYTQFLLNLPRTKQAFAAIQPD